MERSLRKLFVEPGQRFGLLTVIREIGKDVTSLNNKNYQAECLCDCGNTTIAALPDLYRGRRISCGCRKGKFNHGRMSHGHYKKTYYAIAKNGAKKRKLEWHLTFEQYDELTNQPCYYCGTTEAIGIDRIDNQVGYLAENSRPCCGTCNRAKHTTGEEEFIEWIGRAYHYLSEKIDPREFLGQNTPIQ